MAGTIDALRRAASVVAEHGGEEGREWAQRVGDYIAGARDGLKLDVALGIAPGLGECPWWITEARARRDALIIEIATRFYADTASDRRRAGKIMQKLSRYEASGWIKDKVWRSPPERYAGKIEELLFAILKAGQPVSARTVERVLAAARMPKGLALVGIQETQSRDHEKHELCLPQTATA